MHVHTYTCTGKLSIYREPDPPPLPPHTKQFNTKLSCFKLVQGSHRLEKYLNLEGFLEKYLKIKSALKSAGKVLEFYYFLKDLVLLIET